MNRILPAVLALAIALPGVAVASPDEQVPQETQAAIRTMLEAEGYEVRVLLRLLARKAHLERQVSMAASALHDVIDAHFRDWGLTASEADVAWFTVKGLSIADIARLRGSAEGTVKSQLNAIYRKAGVANRGELLSLLIEDLMEDPAEPPAPQAAARSA
jgi:DNA-binding CsgD family transcriptional regulator